MLLPILCSLQLLLSTALSAGLKLNHRASGMRVGVFSCHTTDTCRPPASLLLPLLLSPLLVMLPLLLSPLLLLLRPPPPLLLLLLPPGGCCAGVL
jgi:hypothetical protein